GVDIPVIRIGLSLFFIYVGIRVAMGTLGIRNSFQLNGKDAVAFGDAEFRLVGEVAEKQSFAIAFGQGALDLSTALPTAASDSEIELGVIFGHATIYYSPTHPLRISSQCVLGDSPMPDGNSAFVGSLAWHTPGMQSGTRCVHLKLTVFFGKVTFVAGSLPA